MMKCGKVFAAFLAFILCFFLLSACSSHKSDEELIEAKINQFLTAYNSGDMDGVLECLDSKTKNTFKSAMNIGNLLIGKAGFGIKLSDLFSISIGTMSDDDILTISDMNINISNDDKATVDVVLEYKDKLSGIQEKAFFTMIKEDNDWFINNLESK